LVDAVISPVRLCCSFADPALHAETSSKNDEVELLFTSPRICAGIVPLDPVILREASRGTEVLAELFFGYPFDLPKLCHDLLGDFGGRPGFPGKQRQRGIRIVRAGSRPVVDVGVQPACVAAELEVAECRTLLKEPDFSSKHDGGRRSGHARNSSPDN